MCPAASIAGHTSAGRQSAPVTHAIPEPAPDVARPARGRLGNTVRRVLALVALARAAQFVEAVLFPLVAVHHGAGTAGAATVLLALAVGTTAGSLFGGASVDRLGPRVTATAGLSLAAVAAAALAAVSETWVLAGAAAVYGLATAAWRLAVEAATAHGLASDGPSDAGDQALRERAFGALVWVVNAGALLSACALAAGLDLRSAVFAQAVGTAVAAATALVLVPGGAVAAPPPSGLRVGGLLHVPGRMWLVALAYAPFTAVMFQAFAGLAEVFDEPDYRLMVLVNAVTLVAFPLLFWRLVTRVDGVRALAVAGAAQGGGIAAAALLDDPVWSTIVWSAGEATLIAVMPAVVAGIAPRAATGHYRAAFAAVQGAAAGVATFGGPLLAAWSIVAFGAGVLVLTAAGLAALLAHASSITAGLHQPVACPCGALLCSCDVAHIACSAPSPVLVHTAGRA